MRAIVGLSLLTIVAVVSGTDYCHRSLCHPKLRHIGCRNNGAFSRTCDRPRLVNLKPYVRIILDAHNEKRNEIAGGGLLRFKPAARMATMQWDDELAFLASLNVKQCTLQHDKCRNTDKFRNAGQNLGLESWPKEHIRTDMDCIEDMIRDWFDEHVNCSVSVINKWPGYRPTTAPDVSHFTTMVIDKNIRVGCAAARYINMGYEDFLFACNYATTTLINERIYEISNRPGSKCRTGRNHEYTNLCSKDEVYESLDEPHFYFFRKIP